MKDPNKEDKRKQDLLMKPAKRSPASESENMVSEVDAKKKARLDAIKKVRDKDMEAIIKSMSEKAVMAEKVGDTKEVERLTKKIDKVKSQFSNEQKTSAFKD